MKQTLYYAIWGSILIISLIRCNKDRQNVSPEQVYQKYKTSEYSGDLAHEWMQLGYQMIKDNHLYGPHAARAYGYLGFTLWESVYRGIPGAKSMMGQINDYNQPANFKENLVYDWGTVVCTSLRMVLPEVIDDITYSQRSSIELLAEEQEAQMLDRGVKKEVFEASKDFGKLVGLRMIDRIKKDGRDIIQNILPQLPTRDAAHLWYWDKTTYNQTPVEPLWGTVRTFVLDNSASCEASEPLPFSRDSTSAFYREAAEVYRVPRSDANKKLAYHFDNGPGRTCSAACHWISITEQFLRKDERDLAVSAKAYCLVGFAVADAYSSAWYMKYKYNLLRPATYIHEVIDPNWQPIIATPPYPDYISGASAVAGAASIALISVMEDRAFVDKTHLGSPLYTPDGGPFLLPERSFPSITKCAEEQKESRIVAGVHFRRACEEGMITGRCIGTTILSRLDFGF